MATATVKITNELALLAGNLHTSQEDSPMTGIGRPSGDWIYARMSCI